MEVGLEGGLPLLFCGGWTGGLTDWAANTDTGSGSAAEVGMEVGLEGGIPLLFCVGWTGGSTDWAANTDTGLD